MEKKLDRRGFLSGLSLGGLAMATVSLNGCSSSSSGGLKISSQESLDLYPVYDGTKYQTKDFSRLLGDTSLGLSKANLENHLGLYSNYVKKVNAAEENMRKGIVDDATLKNLAFSLNGMALHDIYFSNMNSDMGKPSVALEKAIEDTYGSFENYKANLIFLAEQVKGWSITGVNLLNGKVLNYALNNHSDNFPNYFLPILALDVYEHAYEIDFGKEGKGQYLEVFNKIIDWDLVSRRFDAISNLF